MNSTFNTVWGLHNGGHTNSSFFAHQTRMIFCTQAYIDFCRAHLRGFPRHQFLLCPVYNLSGNFVPLLRSNQAFAVRVQYSVSKSAICQFDTVGRNSNAIFRFRKFTFSSHSSTFLWKECIVIPFFYTWLTSFFAIYNRKIEHFRMKFSQHFKFFPCQHSSPLGLF